MTALAQCGVRGTRSGGQIRTGACLAYEASEDDRSSTPLRVLHLELSMHIPTSGGRELAFRTALPDPRGVHHTTPRCRAAGAGIEPTSNPGPADHAGAYQRPPAGGCASPKLPACPPGVHLPALPYVTAPEERTALDVRPPRGVSPGSHSASEPAPQPWGSTGIPLGRVRLAGLSIPPCGISVSIFPCCGPSCGPLRLLLFAGLALHREH